MKKVFFAIICVFAASMAVSAQQGQGGNRPTPEESAKRMTEMMTKELNLTADQVTPVDSINLVFSKAQAKLRESANGDFSSMRENMQKLNALRLEAYEKVLTKDQLDTYKKLMEERMRNRGGDHRGQGGGGGNGNSGSTN